MGHFADSQRSISNERVEYPLKMMHAYPKAVVGWGAHTMVGQEAKNLGINNAFIVTTGLKGTGIVEEIQGVLKAADVNSSVYDNVTGNPKDHEVMEGYKQLSADGFDGFISLGGGSSTDCCKAIKLVHGHDGQDVRTFEGAFMATKPNKIPHIAINTTSGTASEVSCFSIINHTDDMYKMALFDPNCTPTLAFNDPALHQCMTGDIAAYTGMDALTHAVEAIASRLLVQSAYGPGLWAIGEIFSHLRQSAANRNNDKAIEQMVWAQMSAGYSFNSAGLGIVHSMAHVLGGRYDAPHGLCNAIGLVDVCRYNLPACPERFKTMAKAAGLDTEGMSDYKAGEKFADAVEELRSELGIRKNFKDLGMQEKDLDVCAKGVLNDICTEGNPQDVSMEDAKKMFSRCMGEEVDFGNR
ncbi:MAG: iron-containing alcohol dehydrogenase family protein [Desulfobacterales bacterium]|nr:iron-containing alcohol dehydrogenase family protein [Desulfobacterales bacterium]